MLKSKKRGAPGAVRQGANVQRRPKRQSPAATARRPEQARILDAVADQLAGHWIRFGTANQSQLFSLKDLQLNEREVFSRFSGPGMTFLTAPARNAFKVAIQAHQDYRPALVADRPGWLGSAYVFGDGTVIAPPGEGRPEIIIAFEPNPKFTPAGTLQGWQAGIGPVVTGQPLAVFALSFGFIGPLLRLAPAHIINLLCEFVGERECGKSTLAIMAASIWAGDPDNHVGGAETWNATINALEQHKRDHADCLLVLDEANVAGDTSQQQREMIHKAIFRIAEGSGKKRFTDTGRGPNVRLALLSTSNDPLEKVLNVSEAALKASQSRMVTIRIPKDRPYGALASLPAGFSDAREAMEHLREATDADYGVAGRAFIGRLVEEAAAGEEALREIIRVRYNAFLKQARREVGPGGSARVSKLMAMTFAAGTLARDWGILPKEWGRIGTAILDVYRGVEGRESTAPRPARPARPLSAIARIRAYVKAHQKELVKVAGVKERYDSAAFEAAPGFWRRLDDGGTEILIPSQRFQQEFPDHRAMMTELRVAGLARTEGGKHPKLTIKAPSNITASGRVYCVRIGSRAKNGAAAEAQDSLRARTLSEMRPSALMLTDPPPRR